METVKRTAVTASLEIGYEQTGPDTGTAIVLLHGFPYDVRQFDRVLEALRSAERRIVVPYLRGFGPTRYCSERVMRSGQQAALGKDVINLLDALGVERAVLAGYDWGGRAACVAAALWPERVIGLVSASGYAIQDIARSARTVAPPATVHAEWYQSYFNMPQGRMGLEQGRVELCRYLWRLWSPTWGFSEEEYARTAASFENPDFVETVLHSYRHRHGNAAGDPALEALEARLAEQPKIAAPTVVLHGAEDTVEPPERMDPKAGQFAGEYRREVLAGVGHCVPAEAPAAVAGAIAWLLERGR